MSVLNPKNLSSKKELRILGMNSGTSADGVDVALISMVRTGKRIKIDIVDAAVIPYKRRIKSVLDKLIQIQTVDLEELGRIDIAYGAYLGRLAREFIESGGYRVHLVASHGQTIGHFPKKLKTMGLNLGTTIQIGDGNALAAQCRRPVISDFRRAGIALGGEGAPLTPFVNQLLFRDRKKSRIIVNIGGISNFSYHPPGDDIDQVKGGDCGPGNVLSDMICRLMFHTAYDRDGALAAKGMVYKELTGPVVEANKHRRVSAGREQFNTYLLARLVHRARRLRACKHDILASANEATALLIRKSIAKSLDDPDLEGIYLTGGGRKNIHMVRQLQKLCRPVPVLPIEALGYDGDSLEAISFAVLGGCWIFGIPSTLHQITGGKSGGVAGKLSLPPES